MEIIMDMEAANNRLGIIVILFFHLKKIYRIKSLIYFV